MAKVFLLTFSSKTYPPSGTISVFKPCSHYLANLSPSLLLGGFKPRTCAQAAVGCGAVRKNRFLDRERFPASLLTYKAANERADGLTVLMGGLFQPRMQMSRHANAESLRHVAVILLGFSHIDNTVSAPI